MPIDPTLFSNMTEQHPDEFQLVLSAEKAAQLADDLNRARADAELMARETEIDNETATAAWVALYIAPVTGQIRLQGAWGDPTAIWPDADLRPGSDKEGSR